MDEQNFQVDENGKDISNSNASLKCYFKEYKC